MGDWYKFRGWDATGQKGWVYGDLTHSKKILKDKPYLADRTMVGGYEVVPESVGICTGIIDFNGKEIYEGDILTDSFDRGYVEYRDAAFIVMMECKGIFPIHKYKLKIIGNVFENTKML